MHYRVEIQYEEKKIYIWTDCGHGSKFLAKGKALLSFQSDRELHTYCEEHGISLVDEETKYDIPSEKFLLSLQRGRKKVNEFCEILLQEWNLALDINNTFGTSNSYLDGSQKLYDKLFYGNNLLLSETDLPYVPSFSKRETRQVKDILREIYDIFHQKL